MLYLKAEGFADTDSVLINSDSGFTSFNLSGVATGDAGYITIAGGNTLLANKVWIDNLVYTLDDGAPALSNDYRDIAVFRSKKYLYLIAMVALLKLTVQMLMLQKIDTKHILDGLGFLQILLILMVTEMKK